MVVPRAAYHVDAPWCNDPRQEEGLVAFDVRTLVAKGQSPGSVCRERN